VFILVRIIYTILSVFVDNSTFNSFTGSVVVRAIMAVLMEIVVIILYIILGFVLQRIPKDQRGEIEDRDNKSGRRQAQGGQGSQTVAGRPRRTRRRGLIGTLISMGIDHVNRGRNDNSGYVEAPHREATVPLATRQRSDVF
jgi:hypothetical protein